MDEYVSKWIDTLNRPPENIMSTSFLKERDRIEARRRATQFAEQERQDEIMSLKNSIMIGEDIVLDDRFCRNINIVNENNNSEVETPRIAGGNGREVAIPVGNLSDQSSQEPNHLSAGFRPRRIGGHHGFKPDKKMIRLVLIALSFLCCFIIVFVYILLKIVSD